MEEEIRILDQSVILFICVHPVYLWLISLKG